MVPWVRADMMTAISTVNDGGYPTTSEKTHNFQFTNSTVIISYSEWEVISKFV